MNPLEPRDLGPALAVDQMNRLRLRQKRAHHPSLRVAMHAEIAEGIVVRAVDDRLGGPIGLRSLRQRLTLHGTHISSPGIGTGAKTLGPRRQPLKTRCCGRDVWTRTHLPLAGRSRARLAREWVGDRFKR